MKKVLIGKKTEIFIICSVLILFGVFLAYNVWSLLPKEVRNAHEDTIKNFSDTEKADIALTYNINLDDVNILRFVKEVRTTGTIIYRLDLSEIEDVDDFISSNKIFESNKAVIINEKYSRKHSLSTAYPIIFVDNDKITIITYSSYKYNGLNTSETCQQLYKYFKGIETIFEKIY